MKVGPTVGSWLNMQGPLEPTTVTHGATLLVVWWSICHGPAWVVT